MVVRNILIANFLVRVSQGNHTGHSITRIISNGYIGNKVWC